jgi:hypothetical protein
MNRVWNMQHRLFTRRKGKWGLLLLAAVLTFAADRASGQGQIGADAQNSSEQAPPAIPLPLGLEFGLVSSGIAYQLPSSPPLLSVGPGDTANVQPIPEPCSGVILLVGSAMLAVARARIRKSPRESSEY